MAVTGTWHWLFLMNVPIGIALVIGGFFYMEETKDKVMEKMDLLGVTLLSFSILIVMFAVNNLGSGDLLRSVLNWSVLGLLILGVLLFTGLILLEKRNEAREVDAILPYRLLENRVIQPR